MLKEAVEMTIAKFGRIDFVICGMCLRVASIRPCCLFHLWSGSGAAGNFLAPISGLSENGFKTVMDIDTVRACKLILQLFRVN